MVPISNNFAPDGKTSSLRMTRQRAIILLELQGLRTHPTAEELHRLVRRQLPRVSLGTVYRNLDLLVRQGLALRLAEACGRQSRFDGDASRHYHVRCQSCGRVDDVFLPSPRAIDRRAAEACGYNILEHRLEFTGLCPKCKTKHS